MCSGATEGWKKFQVWTPWTWTNVTLSSTAPLLLATSSFLCWCFLLPLLQPSGLMLVIWKVCVMIVLLTRYSAQDRSKNFLGQTVGVMPQAWMLVLGLRPNFLQWILNTGMVSISYSWKFYYSPQIACNFFCNIFRKLYSTQIDRWIKDQMPASNLFLNAYIF